MMNLNQIIAMRTHGNKLGTMKLHFITIILLLINALSCQAYRFIFEGMAAGQFPIIMEVDRTANGAIVGRYAYKSTIEKYGRDRRASWMYINPSENSCSEYLVTDSSGKNPEMWSNARFWRENGKNCFSVDVINAQGKHFSISAQSVTRNSTTSAKSDVTTASAWGGTYKIYSEGYRLCPPPIAVNLTLKDVGSNSCIGTWKMQIADEDPSDSGTLSGSVCGQASNGALTLTITDIKRTPGAYTNFFSQYSESYPFIFDGTVIARITKNGTRYKIQPLNSMKAYLKDIIELSIKKTK